MTTKRQQGPGRPYLGAEAVREHVTVRVKPGATAMLRAVGAARGESLSTLIRRYIAEGLSREYREDA